MRAEARCRAEIEFGMGVEDLQPAQQQHRHSNDIDPMRDANRQRMAKHDTGSRQGGVAHQRPQAGTYPITRLGAPSYTPLCKNRGAAYIEGAELGGASGQHSSGPYDPYGSCPCPCPWAWVHGAHLLT